MRAASPFLFVFTVALSVAVFGDPESPEAVQKRNEISKRAGLPSKSCGTASEITGVVSTCLIPAVDLIYSDPLLSVFTGVFNLVTGLMQDDSKFWKTVETRMREVVRDEVASYHDVLAKGFITNIKRSMGLFNRLPVNSQKSTEGVTLSGDINNNQQWVNVEIGRNPQKMILYFMEVISIDVAVLYNLAAAFGRSNRDHWTRLHGRIDHHIRDAEAAASKVMTWRLGKLTCARDTCIASYRKCGPKGTSRCANEAACYKGTDTLRTVCTRKSRASRPSGRPVYSQECNKYSAKKIAATNCNWFIDQVRASTKAWLDKHVYNAVNRWKKLRTRALRASG